MASKSYTLLEYLVTLETELKKLKKIVAESVGADFSELIAQINGIGNELNSFKSSITDTVNTNNSNLTSKFNSLEQQFNTFKTSITNTVNSNNTSLLSKVNSLETQFNSFKTSITSTVNSNKNELLSQLNNLETEIDSRVTDVENRVTTLENSGGSGGSGGSVNIDDTTISKISTWSSKKIEEFVHTNDDVVWSTVQGENLSIEYTKEGYLREVEIWGNTLQNENNLEDIKHLGQLYVDESGQPILDDEGREQYKIEIESRNFYTNDLFYLGNNVSELNLEPNFINTNNVRNSKFTIELECGDFTDGKIIYFNHGYSLELSKVGTSLKLRNFNGDVGEKTKMFNCNKGDIISIVYNGNVNLYVNGKFIDNLGWLQYYGNVYVVQNLSFLKINTISVEQKYLLKSEPKTYKTSILLPCQLCKVGDVADRLYWDSEKGKYVVEKSATNEIIETFILEPLKIQCYRDKTHLFVTGGLDGTIKAKAPLDGGQAIQTLSVKNVALNEEVITLSLENEEIKEENKTQDILIDTTMLATDEIFTMIEPILELVPQIISLERSTSKMVDMYVCMIQRGLKTIEEVPARYREEVKRILEELEK